MKKNAYIFILICLFLPSCRRSTGGDVLLVNRIIDGNTIETNKGYQIRLLGIVDTEESKVYLKKKILHKRIKYRRDTKTPRGSNPMNAYVTMFDGNCINATLLKKGISPINREGLYDSLSVFTRYSGLNNEPQKREVTSKKHSFKKIVKDTEQAVFIVFKENVHGEEIGIGTGFFISSLGVAVSNYHVFEGGWSWYIQLFNSEKINVAEEDILYASEDNDFVIFKPKGIDGVQYWLPFYKQKIEKGEEIFVLGNPDGLESTLTRGVVSAIRSGLYDMELIQIDAAISPGSSGSPVMTMDGKVIGIATLKQNNCENCNFAINIQLINKVLQNN